MLVRLKDCPTFALFAQVVNYFAQDVAHNLVANGFAIHTCTVEAGKAYIEGCAIHVCRVFACSTVGFSKCLYVFAGSEH